MSPYLQRAKAPLLYCHLCGVVTGTPCACPERWNRSQDGSVWSSEVHSFKLPLYRGKGIYVSQGS